LWDTSIFSLPQTLNPGPEIDYVSAGTLTIDWVRTSTNTDTLATWSATTNLLSAYATSAQLAGVSNYIAQGLGSLGSAFFTLSNRVDQLAVSCSWSSNAVSTIARRVADAENDNALAWFFLTTLHVVASLPPTGHIFDGFGDTNGISGGGSNWVWTPGNVAFGPAPGVSAPNTHFLCNDASGSLLADSSGNGHDGVGTFTSADGKINTAIRLDGASSISSPASGIGTHTYSIATWVWPEVYNPAEGQSFFLNNNAENATTLQINGSHHWQATSYSTGGGEVDFVSDGEAALETWTHLVYTYDGDTGAGTFYTNGIAAAIHTLVDPDAGVGGLVLGFYVEGYPCYFQGRLDDIRLIPSCQTAPQVAALYNNGAGREDSDTVGGNTTVFSRGLAWQYVPTSAVIRLLVNNIGLAVTNNTDLVASISRNAGTNWAQTTLSDLGPLQATSGSVRVWKSDPTAFAGPMGSNVAWRVDTFNLKRGAIRALDVSTQE